MEQKEKIIRVTEPIGDNKITCTLPCGGNKATYNSYGERVCDILGVDAKMGAVETRMNPNLQRVCILLNSKKSDNS